MSKRPPFSLEIHEADDVTSAVRLAIKEDTGGALAYLIDHPNEARAFCKRLKSDAPHQCITILTRLLQTLMTEEEGSELVIEGEPAPNLKAAQEAAIAGNMAPVVAFLKAHPDQLRPFCNSFLGSLRGVRNAIGLVMHNLRQGGSRDYYDVMAELLTFLIDQNGENVKIVRSRIAQLIHATAAEEADDGLVEAFNQRATFTLAGQPVHTRVRFTSGREGDPVPLQFLEELVYEEPTQDRIILPNLTQPLVDAGLPFNEIPSVGSNPGLLVVSFEALNSALADGRLILRRRGEDSLEFDIQASASARAAALGIKVIR